MKHIILFILFMGSIVVADAQQNNPLDTDHSFVCSFMCDNTMAFLKSSCNTDPNWIRSRPIPLDKVNPYTEFNDIIKTLKDDKNNPFNLAYSFRECSEICNAVSVMIDSLQIIFYNPLYIEKIKSSDEKLRWAVRAIIAHEIGHQVLNHTKSQTDVLTPAEKRKRELQADFFSGFVIKQFMGSDEEDATQGILSLNPSTYFPKTESQEDGASYPTLAHRLTAVVEGFEDRKDNPIRIAMFRNLDSIAKQDYAVRGKSSIFSEVDKELSLNNFEAAKDKLDVIRSVVTDPSVIQIIDQLRDKLNKAASDFKPSQQNLHPQEMNKKDIHNLEDLKKQLEKGSPLERQKAETIQKVLNQVNSNNLEVQHE